MSLRFSVIIPTFERPSALGKCLEHLAAQEIAKDRFEVIVIDDGGRCDLQPTIDASNANVRLLQQSNQGPAAARNHGAKIAGGDILAFTDDDCLPTPGWLRELDGVCQPDCLVAGHTLNFFPQNLYSQTSQDLVDFCYARQRMDRGKLIVVASNNMAVFRKSFLAIGGFDERFDAPAGEDRDLTDRLIQSDMKLKYCNALIHHAGWLTPGGFVKQHYRYGRGAHLHHRLRKRRNSQASTFQSPVFYGGLLLSPLRARGIRGLPSLFWTGVSQLAHCAGYLGATIKLMSYRRLSQVSG